MSRAAQNREKYFNDIFLRKNRIDDYEENEQEFEDAVSIERGARRGGGLSKSMKPTMTHRIGLDSRGYNNPSFDVSTNNDGDMIRLEMDNISRKIEQANSIRKTKLQELKESQKDYDAKLSTIKTKKEER